MTENLPALYLFVVANLAITAGYLFVAVVIVPKVSITLLRTKIGGVGFFLLCGLTHLGMAFSAITDDQMPMREMTTQWWMLGIHVPQAICVWMFVTGIYIEIGDYGLMKSKVRAREEAVLEAEIEAQDLEDDD